MLVVLRDGLAPHHDGRMGAVHVGVEDAGAAPALLHRRQAAVQVQLVAVGFDRRRVVDVAVSWTRVPRGRPERRPGPCPALGTAPGPLCPGRAVPVRVVVLVPLEVVLAGGRGQPAAAHDGR